MCSSSSGSSPKFSQMELTAVSSGKVKGLKKRNVTGVSLKRVSGAESKIMFCDNMGHIGPQ